MCYMKLSRYWKSGKPVAMSGRSILFCFTKLAAAEIPRIKKLASTAANLSSRLLGLRRGRERKNGIILTER